ncbi:MAG: hypothetical protein JWR42_2890, partial [Marmoricola sp.]|nr:hypothetical protein [Marmoricola sp.]
GTMRRTRTHVLFGTLLTAALVAGLVVAGLHRSGSTGGGAARAAAQDRSVVDASGARTKLTGLAPATGEPTLDGLTSAAPARGTVARVAGPFDDRFRWSGLSLDGERAAGTVTVTSDVSDLLELVVVAGFYDRAGRLVATRRSVHHATVHDEAGAHLPVERERFSIPVPRHLRGTVVSAAVGVPVLVNE